MDPLILKEATRPDHESAENSMRIMDAGLTRPQYVAYLRRFYGIICAWEDYAAAHAPADLQAIVAERRRVQSLAEDLAHFHEPLPKERAVIVGFDSLPEFVGAMYVIEGSTLGGQYIARHVQQVLHLTPQVGNRYFVGYGDRTGAMWQQFRQIIAAVPDQDANRVISAARAMFSIFEDWMKPAA